MPAGIKGYNGNTVYENPYCLPMSFVIDSFEETDYSDENPFEFQNEIYSQLVGRRVELYKEVNCFKTETEDGFYYTMVMPAGNYTLYGNIDFDKYIENSTVNVDNKKVIEYGDWLSPSVFYIPAESGEMVRIEVDSPEPEHFGEAMFYALDLDALKSVTETLSARQAKGVVFDSGTVSGSVSTENDGFLVLSVPFSENWKFTVNGEEVAPLKLGDTLMVLPLPAGENQISGKYTIPYLKAGIIISVLGVFAVIAAAILTYNKRIRDKFIKFLNSHAVRYIIAGGATTFVNLAVFAILSRVLNLEVNISNVISIICAIVFAYVANKIFVFNSKCPSYKALLLEFAKFVGARCDDGDRGRRGFPAL